MSDGIRMYWSMTEGAFNCLIDKQRTDALAAATRKIVRKGDVVVDVGSGTGILAMIAAASGAKRVYAVEADPRNANILEQVFRSNGFENVIRVINQDARSIELPEPIDVFICEMIATGLIEELQSVVSQRLRKFANPNAKYLIEKYECYLDLVENKNNYYGFRFDIPRYEYPGETELASNARTSKTLLFSEKFASPNAGAVELSEAILIESSGILNGLRLYGQTTLGDGSVIGASFAYDYPLILPVANRHVTSGDIAKVGIKYEINGGFDSLRYSVDV